MYHIADDILWEWYPTQVVDVTLGFLSLSDSPWYIEEEKKHYTEMSKHFYAFMTYYQHVFYTGCKSQPEKVICLWQMENCYSNLIWWRSQNSELLEF